MESNRAVLFRFHKCPKVCVERVKLLSAINPEVQIYGLGDDIDELSEIKQAGLEHVHTMPEKNSRWKWRNGDLAVLDWYETHKSNTDFDVLHVIEWDLVVAKSLADMYPPLPDSGFAMSGYTPLREARDNDWSVATGNTGVTSYLRSLVDTSNCREPYAGHFPGISFTRTFLDKYLDFDPPEVGNDELRIGIIGSALGEGVRTGMYSGWGGSPGKFNCKNVNVSPQEVLTSIRNGERYAFHPVREQVGCEKIRAAVAKAGGGI